MNIGFFWQCVQVGICCHTHTHTHTQNGESVTANAVTSRHTNVTETNQRPEFFVHYSTSTHVPTRLEARVHSHQADHMRSHVRMNHQQQALFREHPQATLGIVQTRQCVTALCISYESSMHGREAHTVHLHVMKYACTRVGARVCSCWWACQAC